MSLLHYANLDADRFESLMRKVFYELSPMRQYLFVAKRAIENHKPSLAWEKAGTVGFDGSKRNKKGREGIPIRLLPLSGNRAAEALG